MSIEKTQALNSTEVTAPEARSEYELQLLSFENALLEFLGRNHLPTRNILTAIPQRNIVFTNIHSALSHISIDHRQRSAYLSKFLAAVAAGLFDAALNYLWDETIAELRNRVAQYDLSYFYDSAVGSPEKRKKLSDASDLDKIDDSELIHGAHAIELISPLGFRHLDYIRYMRNWASAAHPNQNELTGLQLVSWLETCIREVISLPLSNIAVEIGRLLSNIRANTISDSEARSIGAFFGNLTQEQVNNLASGLFSIYTRLETTQTTRENIHRLVPFLWARVSESTRQQFGTRYGKFVANNDQAEAEQARKFLDIVSGQAYIPDALRAAEIETAVENLLTAHRAMNNFYNEPAFARAILRLVGETGIVPKQANHAYVLGIVEAFLTNGCGIAWNAEPHYRWLLEKFDSDQALLAVTAFTESQIASRLQFPSCREKFLQLLEMMEPKIPVAAQELVTDIKAFTGPLERMREDSRFRRRVANLQTILG